MTECSIATLLRDVLRTIFLLLMLLYRLQLCCNMIAYTLETPLKHTSKLYSQSMFNFHNAVCISRVSLINITKSLQQGSKATMESSSLS